MWYAVYKTATRELWSVGTVPADPMPAGLAALALAEQPNLETHVWDPSTNPPRFILREPDPLGITLTPDEFRQRYTFAERVASRTAALTDVRVAVLEEDVKSAPVVRLGHPRTVAGVQLLVSVGVLTAERAAEILDPGWTPTDGAA